RAAARPCLGGERARAPECDRAGRHRGDRRDVAGRAPAGRAAGRRDHPRRPAPGRTPDPGGGGGAAHRPRAGAYQRPDRCGGGDFEDSSQHADAEDEGVRPVTGPPPVRVEKALALMPELEALRVAEALQDRRPEVEVLRALGYIGLALGEYAAGARQFQRSLALAEAEFDQAGATAASEGLGDVALAQGQWGGAQAWYSRGLRLAEAASDAPRAGRLERQLGVLARKQRDLAAAGDLLRRARERFEAAGLADEMAGVLNEQGRLDAHLGRYTAASAAYREALAWAQRAPRDARLELSIRLNLAELDLEAGRLLEAEAELRRAEQ